MPELAGHRKTIEGAKRELALKKRVDLAEPTNQPILLQIEKETSFQGWEAVERIGGRRECQHHEAGDNVQTSA